MNTDEFSLRRALAVIRGERTAAQLEAVESAVRSYRQRIEPWVRLRAGMLPINGQSFLMDKDGCLDIDSRKDHWSPEQQALIDQIDEAIKYELHTLELNAVDLQVLGMPTIVELIKMAREFV